MEIVTKRWSLRSAGPALCISTALLLVLLLGGWGAYKDWQAVRQTVLRNEVVRVRSHAERTAGRLERQMAEHGTIVTLSEVAQDNWLRDHWSRFIPPPDLIYGAVVDHRGVVLSHSDPKREGAKLCPNWNTSPMLEAGPEVYSTSCRELTDGPAALDIVVPIQYLGQTVGAYHTGVNRDWIEEQINSARRQSVYGWIAVTGGIVIVELTNVDVRSEVLSVVHFLAPSFKSSEVQLDVEVPEEHNCRVRAGRGQVRQVLLNLLNNALEAVPKIGGRIQIKLERRPNAIKLKISDNGDGIRPENRDRLFSPFFSTKEHGTGLGLAMVRSLMERSGGSARCCRSDPGDCQFQIVWPAYQDDSTTGKSS